MTDSKAALTLTRTASGTMRLTRPGVKTATSSERGNVVFIPGKEASLTPRSLYDGPPQNLPDSFAAELLSEFLFGADKSGLDF